MGGPADAPAQVALKQVAFKQVAVKRGKTTLRTRHTLQIQHQLAGSTLSNPAMMVSSCQRNRRAVGLSTSGKRPRMHSSHRRRSRNRNRRHSDSRSLGRRSHVRRSRLSAAAAMTAAAAVAAATAVAAAAAASQSYAAGSLCGVLLVEDIERRQADVGDFFFTEGDLMTRCNVWQWLHIRCRHGRCGCASH
jgi:hypothetical protein